MHSTRTVDFQEELITGLIAETSPSIPTSFLYSAGARQISATEREEIRTAFGSGFILPQGQDPIPSGASLFNCITQTPEYYANHEEGDLVSRLSTKEICPSNKGCVVTELGPGDGKKSRLVMEKMGDVPFHYQAIDVSADFLRATGRKVFDLPSCQSVRTIQADFFEAAQKSFPPLEKADLALMLGNTFGNFQPDRASALSTLISRDMLKENARIVIGLDSNQNEETLQLAYDDPGKHTSTFALNALVSMKYDLGAKLDFSAYTYTARFIAAEEMMQMGIAVIKDTQISFKNEQSVTLLRGTFIEVGRSYKYSKRTVEALLEREGFHLEEAKTSQHGMAIYRFARGVTPHVH